MKETDDPWTLSEMGYSLKTILKILWKRLIPVGGTVRVVGRDFWKSW